MRRAGASGPWPENFCDGAGWEFFFIGIIHHAAMVYERTGSEIFCRTLPSEGERDGYEWDR